MAATVILTGFMGSGKTAVGERLARRTGMEFFDTDELVEADMGMTVSEAFAERGEVFFRRREEKVVLDLLERVKEAEPGAVVSLGGGAVTSEGVGRRLREEPAVVLLDVDIETAFTRSQDGSRPLAQDREEFERLYRRREETYRDLAKVTVDAGGRSVEEIVDEIEAILGRDTSQ